MIDMTNWYMKEHGVPDSKWHVIEYAGKSKWKCECECGTIKNVDGNCLRRGGSKSCGRCGSKKNKTIDMTRWKMWEHGVPNSKIIVIRQLPTEGGHALWECRCNCGNPKTFKVDGGNLRSGHTLSCGCARIGLNHKSRTGTWHNNIYIGEVIGKDKQGSYLYDCTCFCGNHFIASATKILNNHIQSCGCLKSVGEQKIASILKEFNIIFKQEYQLLDLLTDSNNPRRMDFAVYENNKLKYFIEYQGEQHYNITNNWYSGDIDKLKKQYCENKQIPLIAIPHWHYNDITIEDLKPETSQFLVT